MAKRYLKKISKYLTFINFIIFLFGISFIFFLFLIFFPDQLMFGAFKIEQKPLTLGEIGGFIGGIFAPFAFLLIYLTLKNQQDEFHKAERRHWDSFMSKTYDEQPKLNFKYQSYDFDKENYELSFNFLITNIGKDAFNFKICRSFSSDEDDVINFLNEPPVIHHIPSYSNNKEVILKLVFSCIDEQSIQDKVSIELFCSYLDISQAGRAFYADFTIYPRGDIGFQAEILQRDRAI